MNKETYVQELISSVEERAINSPVSVNWRSGQAMVGAGARNSRSRGFNGYDLYSVREYQYGDDVRKIDWAATARTGGQKVFVSQFYEPREVKFFILVDSKLTMDYGTARTTKRMLAAELACSILKSARKTNDKVGYIVYDEKGIQARSSRAKFVQGVQQEALRSIVEPGVAHLFPQEKAADGLIDEEAFDSAGNRMSGLQQALAYVRRQSRSLVFVISDFIDLSEVEKEELEYTAGKHELIAMYVQDRRERELPHTWGIYMLEDIRKGNRKAIWLPPKWWPRVANRGVRETYADNFAARRAALTDFFKNVGIRWEEFSTEEGVAAQPKLTALFERR